VSRCVLSLYKTPSTATAYTVGQIDNLAFVPHTGFNRLKSVAESVANADAKKLGFNPGAATGTAMYAYDANGNMANDPYKGLGISYNHLNLPTQFTFTPNTNKIDILYDYTGKKLRKTVTTAGAITYIQDYVGNLEWRKQGTDPRRLEAMYHDEGRIVPAYSNATATTPSSYAYEFSMRDHLGNTRLTFADANADGIVQVPEEINQENHYYPFGMSMGYSWLNNASQDSKYQYNGKELSEEFGLNLMDYGARWYDGSIGRWHGIDPLSSKYLSWSPYNYTKNNPVNLIDPNGMSVEGWVERAGQKDPVFDKNINSQADADKNGGGTYIGQSVVSVDENTGEQKSFNSNGIITSNKLLPTATVTAKADDTLPRIDGANNTVGTLNDSKEIALNTVKSELGISKSLSKADESLALSKVGLSGIAKTVQVVGSITGIIGATIAINQAIDNPSAGNIIKAGASAIVPFLGPTVGVIDGILEMSGLKDNAVKGLDRMIDNYQANKVILEN
jgi:RHS repeat-associated protein